jgi:hypothetical protein
MSCSNSGYVPIPETGASLEGTVTYGKAKLEAALIIVVGEKGSATGTIENGRYKVLNAPVGKVTIGVNTEAAKSELKGKMMAPGPKPPMPKLIDVPARYFDPTKSGIETTINKGDNTYDIVISK